MIRIRNCISIFDGNKVSFLFFLTLIFSSYAYSAGIQFSEQMLSIDPNEHIDIARFSEIGYVQPGKYNLAWQVNQMSIGDSEFIVSESDDAPSSTFLCLTPDNLKKIPITNTARKRVKLQGNSTCFNWDSLPGTTYQIDINHQTVYITMPKEYLEYSEENWDPPSLWDEGIPGALFDYNINARGNQVNHGANSYAINSTGVAGLNAGAWRLRSDWQANLQHEESSETPTDRNFKWNQIYMYRAIRSLRANLSLGESYLESDIFDSFRFTGASLNTDTNMLPPNLRDYAPEVSGVARGNAQVEVSQYGRVLYQTQVPAGPFEITDLPSYASGLLDVTITEQDGSQQRYQVNANNIPFLTRPGSLRYKLAIGKPTQGNHSLEDNPFMSGELSWGVSNNWSLYSGSIASQDYKSLSSGLGRNLFEFGALSFDITRAEATMKKEDNKKGLSYRLNYSKQLSSMEAQIQFSATKYDDDYISMADYVYYNQSSKYSSPEGLYNLSFNKRFSDQRFSTTLGYTKRTYQNRDDDYRYDIMLSRYFDILDYKNISVSLNAYHNKNDYNNDRGAFFNISIPWGTYSSVNYNATKDGGKINHTVGVFNRVSDETNYRINIGRNADRVTGSTFINHDASNASLSASSSYTEGRYAALGFNIQGGITATPYGAAIHRIGIPGNSRILTDTDGVSDIAVKGYGRATYSNHYGKAVIPEIRNYYKNKIYIDMNQLPDNADVINTVDTATVTKGAIAYRKFMVNSGKKMMVFIQLSNGEVPPFGAEVYNMKGQSTGIIGEVGSTYLTGINPGEIMTVGKNKNTLCTLTIPENNALIMDSMLLICSTDNT